MNAQTLARPDFVECPECKGRGYFYSTGSSGERKACGECDGADKWPSTLDMIDDLGVCLGADPIERPQLVDSFVRVPNLDLPQWKTGEAA